MESLFLLVKQIGGIRVLNRLIDCYGPPNAIRLDNGPELVSQMFTEWAAAKSIAIRYIQPGKPNQNAFIERFNRTYRTEVLDAYLFSNLKQVQTMVIPPKIRGAKQ